MASCRRIAARNRDLAAARRRRPVELVFAQEFDRIEDAIAAERRIKGWSRAKNEALIAGDPARLAELSRNMTDFPTSA